MYRIFLEGQTASACSVCVCACVCLCACVCACVYVCVCMCGCVRQECKKNLAHILHGLCVFFVRQAKIVLNARVVNFYECIEHK